MIVQQSHCIDGCVRGVLLWHNLSQSETSVRVTSLRATHLREGSGSYCVSARVLSRVSLVLATARVSMLWGVGYPSRLARAAGIKN